MCLSARSQGEEKKGLVSLENLIAKKKAHGEKEKEAKA